MRVVIAEDSALLADGLTRLLQAYSHTVLAVVDNAPELLRALSEHEPELAIVDVRLPPTFTDEGVRAVLAARRQRPGLPVLILSQYVERLYARELLADRAGAVGYLLKDRVANVAAFVAALEQVAAGGTVMDQEVVSTLLSKRNGLDGLSTRELEVLAEMAAGRSNAAIGARLHITEKAVAKHINSIFTKLALPVSEDANRRVQAVLTFLDQ